MLDNLLEPVKSEHLSDEVVMLNKFKICEVFGCSNPVRARNMCKSHRQRLLEYGRLSKVKSGIKIKHPLYGMWNKRKQKKGAFVERWMDFDNFLWDVGSKPENHFLATLNLNEPCGPNNFEWRKIKVKKLPNETDKDYRIRQVANYRLENPLDARKRNYKYNFNLSLEEVEAKLQAQNYLCAICEQPETATYKNTNKVRTLALDHCHKTNKIRDLLCSKCNMFLGKFEDNLHRIDKFHAYLEKHK